MLVERGPAAVAAMSTRPLDRACGGYSDRAPVGGDSFTLGRHAKLGYTPVGCAARWRGRAGLSL